ncbi:MAG: class I SAM-dependent methyltransferase [Terriglobia bacterium]
MQTPVGQEVVETRPPYEYKASPYSSHSLLLALLPARGRGSRILDVGCAGGYLAEILADRGFEVIGIDRPQAIAGRSKGNVNYMPADLDSGLPHLPGTFQFILCADILEHLREPSRLLQEIRTYLAPEGRLLASLPNSGNLYFRLNVLWGRFPRHDRGLFDRTHLHFYTWAGWVDLFSENGFRIENIQPSGIPLGLALPHWKDLLLVRWLESATYALACVWKKLFAYQFIIVARPEAGR